MKVLYLFFTLAILAFTVAAGINAPTEEKSQSDDASQADQSELISDEELPIM